MNKNEKEMTWNWYLYTDKVWFPYTSTYNIHIMYKHFSTCCNLIRNMKLLLFENENVNMGIDA